MSNRWTNDSMRERKKWERFVIKYKGEKCTSVVFGGVLVLGVSVCLASVTGKDN